MPPTMRPRTAVGIAETDLGLRRMDVHVDLFERHRQEQGRNRVAVAGDKVAIGAAERPDEQPILHRARIHEQKLLVGHAAVEGRQADHAGQAHSVALAVYADAVAIELGAEQLRDPRAVGSPAAAREFGGRHARERRRHRSAPSPAASPCRGRPHIRRVGCAGTCGVPAPSRTAARRGSGSPAEWRPAPRPPCRRGRSRSASHPTRERGFRGSGARRWRSTAALRLGSRSW